MVLALRRVRAIVVADGISGNSDAMTRDVPISGRRRPRHARCMPHYRRCWVPGGTYFFTLNLLERRRRLCNDPAVPAQVRPLRHTPRRVSSCPTRKAGKDPPFGGWPADVRRVLARRRAARDRRCGGVKIRRRTRSRGLRPPFVPRRHVTTSIEGIPCAGT